MYKVILALAFFGITAHADQATITCASKDLTIQPYVSFEFTVTSKKGGSVFGQPKEVRIAAWSLPFYGAETMFTDRELIETCTYVTSENSVLDINCGNEDGEGGRATLNLISNEGLAWGSVGFPNGFSVYGEFIDESKAGYDLVCKIH